jgi:hypothetical protein
MRGYKHSRLDGSTNRVMREVRINLFNKPQSPQFIFCLSTRYVCLMRVYCRCYCYCGTVGNYIDVSALLVQIGVHRQSYSDTLSDSVRNFCLLQGGRRGCEPVYRRYSHPL